MPERFMFKELEEHLINIFQFYEKNDLCEKCQSTEKFAELMFMVRDIFREATDKHEQTLGVLFDVLHQACGSFKENEKNNGDSYALRDFANGLRHLSKYGLFEIQKEAGRRVIGKFKELEWERE